ncbi:MAG TPA: lysophospholipid acyltransferase family protein [Acidimicrobiales bacterium]|nr:lysophospholipid acyltransferase family protein [Acidimicrobiales bacterium]
MPVRYDTGAPSRGTGIGFPPFVYRFLRLLAHLINRAYWRVEVDGAAHVPATGPVILAPVHRSFMDFFAVSEVTKRKIFYMTKDEMWRTPLLGSFLDAVGAFPVHREGADRLALDRAQDVLERGDVLILFPEGTRRAGPVVQDLHEGAAFLAARTGAVIVPIGVGGTAQAMPKGSKFVRPVKVHLVVGAPLAAPERSARGRVPRTQVHALTEQLRTDLQALYDTAEGRAARPGGRAGAPGG